MSQMRPLRRLPSAAARPAARSGGDAASLGVMPSGADAPAFLRALDAMKQPEAEGYAR